MPTLDGDNVTGALVFFGYIVAALIFSGLIGGDLVKEYHLTWERQRMEGKGRKGKDSRKLLTKLQVPILAALSTLSFAILSYHMLSFLIQSYQRWALPESWRYVSVLKIWRWSTSSTLFQDFAEAINKDASRSWWTSLALTYTFAWNVYMAVEGNGGQSPYSFIQY